MIAADTSPADLTLLERGRSALLLVDVQQRLLPAVDGASEVLAQCVWLAKLAAALDVPTVITEHMANKIGATEPALRTAAPSAQVVAKSAFSAVRDGVLEATALRERPQVVIAGIEAHVCMLQTALELQSRGWALFAVSEACGSRRAADRDLALARLRAHGVHVVSREMVAFEWLARGDDPQFGALTDDPARSQADTRRAHRRALLLMLLTATLWSTAGVVTRLLSPELQAEGRFEITFWRSLFAALFVAGTLLLVSRDGLRGVRAAGWPGLLSGSMWAVMFVCFMLALTLTTVANTLLVMSVGPLLTALLARVVLGTPIPVRTLVAIAAATAGMTWMFASSGGDGAFGGTHLAGMLVAFAVPLASSVNLVTLNSVRAQVDLVPAVFIGGVLSAAAMLPFALPLQAGLRDIALLALLGFFQLGLPCMLMIRAARHLSAPEIALLALLEVLLGPIWAWVGAGEVPATATLYGGGIVLAALVFNEVAGLRTDRSAAERSPAGVA